MLHARLRRTPGKLQAQRLSSSDLFYRTHDLAISFLDDTVAALQYCMRIQVRKVGLHGGDSCFTLIEKASLRELQPQA